MDSNSYKDVHDETFKNMDSHLYRILHDKNPYKKKTQRGLVVRAKYFGISHARGHRFRTAVSKAWETLGRVDSNV